MRGQRRFQILTSLVAGINFAARTSRSSLRVRTVAQISCLARRDCRTKVLAAGSWLQILTALLVGTNFREEDAGPTLQLRSGGRPAVSAGDRSRPALSASVPIPQELEFSPRPVTKVYYTQ